MDVVDHEHTRGLEGVQERAVGRVGAVRQAGGRQAERGEHRGAQLRQGRLHRDRRAAYRDPPGQQTQRLVNGDSLAVAGVAVHAHDPVGGDGVGERFGDLAELARRHDVRAGRV
ncbi:hypothetical protein OG948_00465 [Embleya sp. NBC_00888]|nr:hypothetical protein OG948_00465 [Embleya sp. NBC_00888]